MMFLTSFCRSQLSQIMETRFFPMPGTSRRRTGAFSMTSMVSVPNSVTMRLAIWDPPFMSPLRDIFQSRTAWRAWFPPIFPQKLPAVCCIHFPVALCQQDGTHIGVQQVSNQRNEIVIALDTHLKNGVSGFRILIGDPFHYTAYPYQQALSFPAGHIDKTGGFIYILSISYEYGFRKNSRMI